MPKRKQVEFSLSDDLKNGIALCMKRHRINIGSKQVAELCRDVESEFLMAKVIYPTLPVPSR